MKIEEILDAFDRAAHGHGRWDAALASFAAFIGARAALIAGIDRQGALTVSVVSGFTDAQSAEYVAGGGPDPRVNPRTRAALRGPMLRTIVDADFGTPDTLRRHPFYKAFFVRHDLPHCTLTKLHDDGQRAIFLALLRSNQAGPASEAERHEIDHAAPLIRDAIIAGLQLERQKIDLVGNTLDYLATPAIALNARGQVVALSPLAGAVLRDGRHLTIGRGGLLLHSAERQRALGQAIAATCHTLPPAERRGVSLMIPAIDGGPMLTAAVAPLPFDTEGWLHTACCMVFLRSRTSQRDDLARYLAHHHLLTNSECDIALHLIEGRDARMIATLRTVTEGTVRNQIKTVLAKTGYRRQIDLVSALRP